MAKLMLAGLLLIGTVGLNSPREACPSNLRHRLATQHFSGMLKGDIRFTSLGTLRCGANNLRMFFYEWYESSPPGLAIHASYRVIVMDGGIYVGSYVVEDRPKNEGDRLLFPYDSHGKSIGCGTSGVLPKKVLLNGEVIPLAK